MGYLLNELLCDESQIPSQKLINPPIKPQAILKTLYKLGTLGLLTAVTSSHMIY